MNDIACGLLAVISSLQIKQLHPDTEEHLGDGGCLAQHSGVILLEAAPGQLSIVIVGHSLREVLSLGVQQLRNGRRD